LSDPAAAPFRDSARTGSRCPRGGAFGAVASKVRPLVRPDLEKARNAAPGPFATTGISGSSAPFWASDLMAARSFE